MTTSQEPNLAPPGAGLPRLELLVAQIQFALLRWLGSRRSFDVRIAHERELIRTLLRKCNADVGARRVLIPRIPGLEDSSRYWSVWMTLDHLRIVHESLAHLIGELAREVTRPGAASTAAVKPNADVGPEVVAAFEASCDALASAIAASPNLNTQARYPHPWFGPLNATGWHALVGAHMSIHRVQIERILAALDGSGG